MNFYYECEGQPKGPVSEDVLRQLHADGAVNDATLVVGEGEPAWTPFSVRMATPVEESPTTGLAKSRKQPISAVAVHIANRAVSTKGEFDALETICFPESKSRGEFLNDSMPLSWTYFYRLHFNGKLFSTQLYVVVCNYSSQGILRYNTAKTAGGNELEVKNINVVRSGDIWEEHLAISIPAKTLALAGFKPLRIQVSRPDKGISFVIEVPVDVSLAVAYRLNPDSFQIVETSSADQREGSPGGQQTPLSAAVGAGALAFFAGWLSAGFFIGLIFGVAVAAYVWNKTKNDVKQIPVTTAQSVNEATSGNS